MTWNVRGLRDDPDAVAAILHGLAPQVVCLQECPRPLRPPFALVRLAQHSGLRLAVGGGRASRTAILVSRRGQVLATDLWHLSRAPGLPPRPAAVLRYRCGSGTLTVVCVHLGLDAAQRQRHVEEIIGRVDLRGLDRMPLVVAGDFNETDERPAWQRLTVEYRDPGGGGAPTFPAKRPRHRIDAIMTNGLLSVRLPMATAADLLPAELNSRLSQASDHVPVVADIHPAR